MSNAKFASGEWKFKPEKGAQHGVLGSSIGKIIAIFKKQPSDEDVALIIAAPKMYEMLESVLSEMHMLIDEVNDQRCSHRNPMSETPPELHDGQTLHEIQLLLAEARGELK